jgi:phospholipid-translocating ATPase
MDLRKVHVGTVSYANEAMDEVAGYVRQGFASPESKDSIKLVTPKGLLKSSAAGGGTRTRREIGSRVRDLVLALALCHNVTPTTEEINGEVFTAYQASSPDEIAIVKWTESVGLRVVHRDRHTIALESVELGRTVVKVRILDVFPFTSESKRMGILLEFFEDESAPPSPGTGEIWFYQKGADTVMTKIVAANDWLDEETANMAREGLRTLVVGRRKLSPQQYADFSASYKEASLSLQDRDVNMAEAVRTHLEHNLDLLGVTGVEDRLQKDVKPSLELLRNAGIKIWMLTGDKVETARCVAVSAKLVSRSQHIHPVTGLEAQARDTPNAVNDLLSYLGANPDSTALLIDGDSLSFLLAHHRQAFIAAAVLLPAVIACRCSPTQKADIALLIRAYTKKRVACIGDGGNDVSMIQAADVGVGIVGKEGRQASLAADFSITQFHHLTKLLVWHGRNSYKRSAKLGQFVIHRGLVISVAQTVYSASTAFLPNALFRDWLLVGYATLYTQLPIFSFVLDRDIDEALAHRYPELYKELAPGTSLSYKTFFKWLAVSVYQGTVIQVLAQVLTHRIADPDPDKKGWGDPRMVAVAFTVLVVNELGMVAMEVTLWHWLMVASIVVTFGIYAASVPMLRDYYDLQFLWSWGFVWRVVAIAAIALVPPYVFKIVRRAVKPPSYRKVRGV